MCFLPPQVGRNDAGVAAGPQDPIFFGRLPTSKWLDAREKLFWAMGRATAPFVNCTNCLFVVPEDESLFHVPVFAAGGGNKKKGLFLALQCI